MRKKFPRDRYTGPGGGLYRGAGGGMDPFNGGGMDPYNGGGLDTSPGGGLYAGPCANPYRSCTPPMHIYIPELRKHGFHAEADLLAKAHGL